MIDEILVPKVNKIPRSALPIERIRMPAKIFAGRIELAIDYGRDEGTSPYTEKRSDAIESEGKRFFLFKREKWRAKRRIETGSPTNGWKRADLRICQFSVRGE